MKESLFFKISCLVLLIVCLSLPSQPRQEQENKNQAALHHEVSVTLKLVQVYILDKSGNAVADLAKADFELYDNGQAKPITDFESHELSLDQIPQVPPSSVPSGPVSKTNRKFFLFFDFAFNNKAGISKSRTAALNFLDTQIRPEDEVGVISFSARKGLTLHEYLTSDHRRIRQVVAGLGPSQFLGRAWGIESEWLKDHLKLDRAIGSDTTSRIAGAEQSILKKEAIGFASQISELAKALRNIPGIKNIILFSSGIPNYALYGGSNLIDETGGQWGDAALRDRYNEMCKELAGSNSAVYAVNVSSAGSAPFEESDLRGDGALRQLARDSGGKYFDNINSYENINRTIQQVTGTYYVLGYYIDEKWDGRFHNVRVEVKREGCSVFGQKGYFNPKLFSEYSENEKVLHLIDLALSEKPHLQEPVDFPLLVLPYAVGEKTDLAILAKIPVKKIREMAGEKSEVATLMFDQNNDVVALEREEIGGWPSAAEEAFFGSAVSLSPGRYECRVVLRNMASGMGARGSYRVNVPGGPKSGLTLLPPLLLKTGQGTVFLNEGDRANKDHQRVRFSDIYPFDGERYCPLMEPLDKAQTKLFALVRCLESISTKPELAFSGQLVNVSSGERIPIPTSIVKQSQNPGISICLLELAIGELKPGEYALYIFADETASGSKAFVSSYFVVQ